MKVVHHTNKQAGQSLVEFVITLPLLLIMLVGVAETGNAINAYIGVVNTAREGARLASRGNIYSAAQVTQVMLGETGNLDLAGRGSLIMTVVKSDISGFVSYTPTQLLGTASSRFTPVGLATLYQQAISTGNRDYLAKERLVVVEVFYNCPTLTQFLWANIPMYGYAIMKISAAS